MIKCLLLDRNQKPTMYTKVFIVATGTIFYSVAFLNRKDALLHSFVFPARVNFFGKFTFRTFTNVSLITRITTIGMPIAKVPLCDAVPILTHSLRFGADRAIAKLHIHQNDNEHD